MLILDQINPQTMDFFVPTGLLNLTDTDDQLAALICHQLAHATLDHRMEVFSLELILGLLMAPFITAYCAIVPYNIMAVIFTVTVVTIFEAAIISPNSR